MYFTQHYLQQLTTKW